MITTAASDARSRTFRLARPGGLIMCGNAHCPPAGTCVTGLGVKWHDGFAVAQEVSRPSLF